MKELEILSAFMIGGHDLNNMRSTNDTVLITDTERKVEELLQKTVKENKKKELNINCKKIEFTVFRKR